MQDKGQNGVKLLYVKGMEQLISCSVPTHGFRLAQGKAVKSESCFYVWQHLAHNTLPKQGT